MTPLQQLEFTIGQLELDSQKYDHIKVGNDLFVEILENKRFFNNIKTKIKLSLTLNPNEFKVIF